MNFVKCRLVVAALVAVAMGALVSAQITFSRDWAGGKRAAPALPPAMPLDCTQFTRLCRHFVHELKAAMSSPGQRRRMEDAPPMYDDDK